MVWRLHRYDWAKPAGRASRGCADHSRGSRHSATVSARMAGSAEAAADDERDWLDLTVNVFCTKIVTT